MDKVKAGKKILRELSEHGYQGYFVGGVVRDIILGRKISDVDIATDAKPNKVIEIFKTTIPIGLKHGTVLVIYDNINFEITTFRSDGKYLDFRHPKEVKYISNLEEDLSRRDFTINAIAMDINNQIIDPFEGKKAISQKIIKTVGNSKERFLEDPLRMLRAIRLASQLNFSIDDNTLNEIKNNVSYFQYISNERVKIELDKIMQSDYAHIGIELLYESTLINWIKGLNDTKITNIDYIIVARLIKKTNNLLLRWFLFFYPLEQTERQLAMNILKFSNKEKARINKVYKAFSILNSEINIKNIKKSLIETDDETCAITISVLWILNKIDEVEKNKYDIELEEIKKELVVRRVRDLDIDGNDLMVALNLSEGPWINVILDKLFNKVVFDNLINQKTFLLKEALLIKEEIVDGKEN